MDKLLSRLILGLLSLAILIFSLRVYLAFQQAETTAKRITTLTSHYLDTLVKALPENGEPQALQAWLDEAVAMPEILFLDFVTPATPPNTHNLVGHMAPSLQAQSRQLTRARWASSLMNWVQLPWVQIIDRPVHMNGQNFILRAVVDLNMARDDWDRTLLLGLSLLLIGFVVVIGLFALLYRKPIRALNEAMIFAQQVALGAAPELKPLRSGVRVIDSLRAALQNMSQRVQQQQTSLAASESKYRNAINELDAVVFQVGIDLTWKFLSEGWHRLTGLETASFINKEFGASFSEVEHSRLLQGVGQLLKQQRSEYRDELMLLRADGSYLEVEMAMHTFKNERGEILGMTGTLTDYARRRDHEMEVTRQRRLFQQIIDQLPVSIYVKNEQSDYVLVNCQGAETLSFTPEQMTGKTERDFQLPDNAAERYAEDREVLRTGQSVEREQVVSLHGEIRHWLSRKVRLDAGNGNMLVLQATVDITELKKIELELERQREFIELVVNTDPTLIFVKDEEQRFVMVNSAFAKVFGKPRDYFIGKRMEDIHHQSETVTISLQASTQGARHSRGNQDLPQDVIEAVKITPAKGETRYFLTTYKPLRMPDERIHTLGIQQDITQLKHNEEALIEQTQRAEAASQAKSEFLANMSHEIRTPMNGIIGMTDLTLKAYLSPQQRQYLQLCRESAAALLALINEILDFSKIEAGRMTLEMAPFSFYELMAEITKPLGLQAHTHGLSFLTKISPQLPLRLIGDSTRLRQVLVNLLGNAIKFTKQGSVVLEVEPVINRTPDTAIDIQFTVRDTGIGIAPEKQKVIFEPFAQADGSTSRHYGGTGLGLTISSQLIELMGGKMELKSQPNVGSEFSFTVPFQYEVSSGTASGELTKLPASGSDISSAGTSNTDAPQTLDSREFRGRSIAWLDCSHERCAWSKQMLSYWQFETYVATSVAHAAELSLKGAVDFICLDDELSLDEAQTLISAIRKKSPQAALILMVRIYSPVDNEIRESALERQLTELGEAFTRLIKPVTPLDLHRTLLRLVRGEPEINEPPAPVYKAPLPRRYTLLAEDNRVNQLLAMAALENCNHQVDIAEDGEETLRKLEKNNYDVVLMDVQMPNLGGLETTERWRRYEAENQLERTPIIAMTAHAMQGDKEKCLASGMNGYISKPLNYDTLYQQIEDVLKECGKSTLETVPPETGSRAPNAEPEQATHPEPETPPTAAPNNHELTASVKIAATKPEAATDLKTIAEATSALAEPTLTEPEPQENAPPAPLNQVEHVAAPETAPISATSNDEGGHTDLATINKDTTVPTNADAETADAGEFRFSREQLLKAVHNDPVFMKRIARVFVESAVSVNERLQQAKETQDAHKIKQVAHEIKGMAWNLGARDLGELTEQMEKLADQDKPIEALKNYEQIYLYFQVVLKTMKEVHQSG